MKKRTLIRLWAAAGAFACVTFAAAQGTKAELSKKLKSEVIESLAASLVNDYVFPDVGAKMAADIRSKHKSGAYSKIADSREFAEAVTNDMRAIAQDKHLALRYFGDMMKGIPSEEETKTQEELQKHAMKVSNYGFRKAEILPGNVGYLKVDGFPPVDLGKDACDASMEFLKNTDALVIDLRDNFGGDPALVCYLASYFLKPGTHINDLYFRKGNRTEEFRTSAPQGQVYEKTVYVLISGQTFSGGEEFAYDIQTQKRGILVGETTGGGANPGDETILKGHFVVFMPNGRAINPITKTNWEGTGVIPDVSIPVDEALQYAHEDALKGLVESAPERYKSYFQRALDRISKKANP